MSGGTDHGELADEAVGAVDGDLVLVAEHGNGDLDFGLGAGVVRNRSLPLDSVTQKRPIPNHAMPTMARLKP